MSGPTSFITDIVNCRNSSAGFPSIVFPQINLPGFPNYNLGMYGAAFGGINYVLQFLPPDPHHLPGLPDISLFLDPMMASLKLPSNYPSFNISLSGLNISIPGLGTGNSPFPIDFYFRFISCAVAGCFGAIKIVIDGLQHLQIVLPTFGQIKAIFDGLFLEAGLPYLGLNLPNLSGCIASSLADLFSSNIG